MSYILAMSHVSAMAMILADIGCQWLLLVGKDRQSHVTLRSIIVLVAEFPWFKNGGLKTAFFISDCMFYLLLVYIAV
jgi:hypothetical protein